MKGISWKTILPGIILVVVILVIGLGFLGTAQGLDMSQYFGLSPTFGDEGEYDFQNQDWNNDEIEIGIPHITTPTDSIYHGRSEIGCFIAKNIEEYYDGTKEQLHEYQPKDDKNKIIKIVAVSEPFSIWSGTEVLTELQKDNPYCNLCNYLDEACINKQLAKRKVEGGIDFCDSWGSGGRSIVFGNKDYYEYNNWCSEEDCKCENDNKDLLKYSILNGGLTTTIDNIELLKIKYDDERKETLESDSNTEILNGISFSEDYWFQYVIFEDTKNNEIYVHIIPAIRADDVEDIELSSIAKLVAHFSSKNYARAHPGGTVNPRMRSVFEIDFTPSNPSSIASLQSYLWDGTGSSIKMDNLKCHKGFGITTWTTKMYNDMNNAFIEQNLIGNELTSPIYKARSPDQRWTGQDFGHFVWETNGLFCQYEQYSDGKLNPDSRVSLRFVPYVVKSNVNSVQPNRKYKAIFRYWTVRDDNYRTGGANSYRHVYDKTIIIYEYRCTVNDPANIGGTADNSCGLGYTCTQETGKEYGVCITD